MLSLRAVRSPALRTAASSARRAARGFATVSEEAPAINSDLLNKDVELSLIEKGKGYYLPYKRVEDNLKICLLYTSDAADE